MASQWGYMVKFGAAPWECMAPKIFIMCKRYWSTATNIILVLSLTVKKLCMKTLGVVTTPLGNRGLIELFIKRIGSAGGSVV